MAFAVAVAALVLTTALTALSVADVRAQARREDAWGRRTLRGLVAVNDALVAGLARAEGNGGDVVLAVADRAHEDLARLPGVGREARRRPARAVEEALEAERSFVALLGVVSASEARLVDDAVLARLTAAWKEAVRAMDRAHRHVHGRPAPRRPGAAAVLARIRDSLGAAGDAGRAASVDLAELDRYDTTVGGLLDGAEEAGRELERVMPADRRFPTLDSVVAFDAVIDAIVNRIQGAAEDLRLMAPPAALEDAHELLVDAVEDAALTVRAAAHGAALASYTDDKAVGEDDDYAGVGAGREELRSARRAHDAALDDHRRRLATLAGHP